MRTFGLTHFVLLCLPSPATPFLWNFLVIFPQIRCFLRLFFLNYDPADIDRFDSFFRDETIWRIAEFGEFRGQAEIKEYSLAGSNDGPYFSAPIEIEDVNFSFLGYDYDEGTCTFLGSTVISQKTNPANTAGTAPISFRIASMAKIVLDLGEGFVRTQDAFLPSGWWEKAIEGLQDSDETRSFVCRTLENECAGILPAGAADRCLERLSALPFYTEIGEDGIPRLFRNSQSCRALHSSLAVISGNPEVHCPHMSFDPAEDPDGTIKCQDDSGALLSHADLFTQEELNDFNQFILGKGFDSSGTDFVLP